MRNHEESNTLNQSIVPSTHPRIGSLPRTNNQPNMQFQFNMMTGDMTDCVFYVPDTGDNTGLAFRVAFDNAVKSSINFDDSHKKLCTSIGSMLCSVIPGFRNSIETALNGIGISPRFVSLPSQAHENNIVSSKVTKFDWSSTLVVFGYCILLLFKVDNNLFGFSNSYNRPTTTRVYEMRAKVGCSPSNSMYDIPFDEQKENAIRTMLSTQPLCNTLINFLLNNLEHPNAQIRSLCQYLSYVLSWSGDMRVFTVMYERLVKTKSPVLSHSLVITEVDNLEELVKAIVSHTYPQCFSHLCSVSELFYLDVLRFRTLFVVALEMDIASNSSHAYGFKSENVSNANPTTVWQLVKFHYSAMAKNQVSERILPTIPGI